MSTPSPLGSDFMTEVMAGCIRPYGLTHRLSTVHIGDRLRDGLIVVQLVAVLVVIIVADRNFSL